MYEDMLQKQHFVSYWRVTSWTPCLHRLFGRLFLTSHGSLRSLMERVASPWGSGLASQTLICLTCMWLHFESWQKIWHLCLRDEKVKVPFTLVTSLTQMVSLTIVDSMDDGLQDTVLHPRTHLWKAMLISGYHYVHWIVKRGQPDFCEVRKRELGW